MDWNVFGFWFSGAWDDTTKDVRWEGKEVMNVRWSYGMGEIGCIAVESILESNEHKRKDHATMNRSNIYQHAFETLVSQLAIIVLD
jgi:hypothetical protein